ncbi:hypothetical protein BSAF29S_07108 [Bacillus safensis subsp. safensis]
MNQSQSSRLAVDVVIIDKKYHSTILRVMVDTSAIDEVKTGKWYEFTGVLSRYDTLQVLPRHKGDISLLKRQPMRKIKKEYEATVDRVVDGDTIHLEAVLGTTKVRFVNMDTPETYHKPKNELDQNQLRFGQKAADYLNTSLSSGEQLLKMEIPSLEKVRSLPKKAIADEIDVIFAGHNHEVVNGEVNEKLIVQAF